MNTKQHFDIYKEALDYVKSYPGTLAQLARESHVSPEWLQKFIRGERKNPGVLNIQKILDHRAKNCCQREDAAA